MNIFYIFDFVSNDKKAQNVIKYDKHVHNEPTLMGSCFQMIFY